MQSGYRPNFKLSLRIASQSPATRAILRQKVATSSPLALAEHRNAAAVGMDAVDIGLVRADHPVDVDQALVAALRRDLLRRKFRAVDEAFRITLAKRDVARRVLVEQRVEEQQAAFRNRRGMRHQRHL